MRKLVPLLLPILAALTAAPTARADVKPNPLFADNMVLQRGTVVPVWGTGQAGEKVTVRIEEQEASTTTDKNGKWKVELKPLKAGGPYDLKIAGNNTVEVKNVLVGEVWVCSGQSNMEWPLRLTENADKAVADAKNPKIRLFTVKKTVSVEPRTEVVGKWDECTPETVPNFSAVGYFFGRDVQKALDVPVGLIHSSWGGTPAEAWAPRASLERNPDLKYYVENLDAYAAKAPVDEQVRKQLKGNPNLPTVLYNGMIAPLQPFAVKGAIWYQGESNAGRAVEYRTLFPVMIEGWHETWGEGAFPFYFVQLAPWRQIVKTPAESDWAELREAQLLTTRKLKNTAQAVITDVGDEKDIHPRKKEPVGARLALAALAKTYGKDVVYSGPEYSQMKREGNKIVLSFQHVGGGLEARGDRLEGFAIAGQDRKFVNAEAKIEGDQIVVWSPEVADPVAVRYGWANYPVVNLYNKAGLPATPFRTDDFPAVTADKKQGPYGAPRKPATKK